MKVLLLGGTGVLSTEVCEEAIRCGYEVYTVTRGQRKNLLSDKAHNLFADVYDEKELEKVLEGLSFDVAVDFLVRFPEDLKRTLRILKNRCKQFVFVSTATVYKNNGEIISESSEIGNRHWDYALEKEQCEQLLKSMGKEYVESYTIVRPYVTYGKTRIPSAIAPVAQWSLVNRMMNEKPIPLWDGGYARLNLTHSKDFAKGMVGLFGNEKAFCQDFHITSREEVTWRDITEMLASLVGNQAITMDIPADYMAEMLPEFEGPLKYDKSKNWVFDNTKICEAIPLLTFDIAYEEGLKETIRYYMENAYMRSVDYLWEGKIDRMMRKYLKSQKRNFCKEKLSLKACKETVSVKNRCLYWIGREAFLTKIYLLFHKVGRLMRRISKRISKK